jgi:hypothetical protein
VLLSAAAAAVLLVGIALLAWLRHPDGAPGPLLPLQRQTAEEDRHPTGRPLRQDFHLGAEPVGARFDPESRAYVLKVGHAIKFRVEAGIDCEVLLYNLTDTKTILLFPNETDRDGRLRAGVPRHVPDELNVEARAPSGLEHVCVLAATNPLHLHKGEFRGGFEVFDDEDRKELLQELRELGAARPDNKIAERVLRFRIEE